MRIRISFFSLLFCLPNLLAAQPSSDPRVARISNILNDTIVNEVTLLFIGDVMGHGSQIKGAYYDDHYDYKPVFKYVKPIIEEADIAVANLELTHAGPPYKGYPQFSSPDSLSSALKWAGVDMLITANNHSCDRRKQGVERTIKVLDSYDIPHTGTFFNQEERDKHYPLMMEENGIKMAFLNYTYGTNGLPATPPNIVNLIDKAQIEKDIEKAKINKADAIIVTMHWGIEYQRTANQEQRDLAKFCFDKGATMVIGSHPHVIQEFERYKYQDTGREVFVCYSLGNFVSNQNDLNTRGGAMARVTLRKVMTDKDTSTTIGETNFYTTWVHRPIEDGVKRFHILPASTYSQDSAYFGDDLGAMNELEKFLESTQSHMKKVNISVNEYYYAPNCVHPDKSLDNYEWNFGDRDSTLNEEELKKLFDEEPIIYQSKIVETKQDSIYRIVIKLGQHKSLRDDIWCKDVLKKIDWSSGGNNDEQITLGPFTNRKEAENYITTYSDCLEGYNLSISAIKR